jgi:hypothetical protein
MMRVADGWLMLWFPVAACIALLGAIVARLSIPAAHRRHLRLSALEAEIAAEAQQLEQARKLLEKVDGDIRDIDSRFVSLGREIPQLREEFAALRRRPVWPAREIVLTETDNTRVYVARLERLAGGAPSVWAVPNYLIIYAESEGAAVAGAMSRYPSAHGYSLAFATTSFPLHLRHRDRVIQFADPTPAAAEAQGQDPEPEAMSA